MANDRAEDNGRKGSPEGQRDDSQGRRSGRHRGFRGRHGQGGTDSASTGGGAPRGQPNGGRGAQGGRDGNREEQGQRSRAPRPEELKDMPVCSICGKAIYDLSTAISASREAGEPAHFDCVLERVIASESLAAGEKLVYLGSGCFAVVEFKDKTDSAFQVKRRIQWEKEGEKKDWRKGISARISNL